MASKPVYMRFCSNFLHRVLEVFHRVLEVFHRVLEELS